MKPNKAYAKMIAKAWSDPKFKQRLLKDPEVVFRECGIEISKGKKVQVNENSDAIMYFVLPQKPAGDMSVKDLEAAAAAGCACPCE